MQHAVSPRTAAARSSRETGGMPGHDSAFPAKIPRRAFCRSVYTQPIITQSALPAHLTSVNLTWKAGTDLWGSETAGTLLRAVTSSTTISRSRGSNPGPPAGSSELSRGASDNCGGDSVLLTLLATRAARAGFWSLVAFDLLRIRQGISPEAFGSRCVGQASTSFPFRDIVPMAILPILLGGKTGGSCCENVTPRPSQTSM